MNAQALASFVWSIAELLRGDYKPSEYGKVILPFTVLRRLDCVLEPTKEAVLHALPDAKATNLPLEPFLLPVAQQSFFNISPLDFQKLLGDSANIKANVETYVDGFSENARDIFVNFELEKQLAKLDKANLLYMVVQRFSAVDLHPKAVSNADMGVMFEELIRRFAELSNETAGDHFTPREVIRLMVNILFSEDNEALSVPGTVRTIYDPTAGTGGMLSIAEDHITAMNPQAKLSMHGQEFNEESYAICKSDMLVKGQDVTNIVFGNTLNDDKLPNKKFDYMLSNPPYGVDWKKVQDDVRKEHTGKKLQGRFGPGLPRISDGSLLFVLHLISKMRDPEEGGSRIGIVLNASPLFSGGAGAGESEIRRHLFENDLVEAIVALPTDMFYNTGLATYIWIISNKKSKEREGKVQLVNATMFWRKMRKSLGSKRRELSTTDIANITKLYGEFAEKQMFVTYDGEGRELARQIAEMSATPPAAPKDGRVGVFPISKICKNSDFGYWSIVTEQPLTLVFRSDEESLGKLAHFAEEAEADESEVEQVRTAVTALLGVPMPGRKAAQKAVKEAVAKHKLELSPWGKKALWFCIEWRDPQGEIQKDSAGKPEPDPLLRDGENVPFSDDIDLYFEREVKPHAPLAWVDKTKTKVGYEVPFNQLFYTFTPPRDLSVIDQELKLVTKDIVSTIAEMD